MATFLQGNGGSTTTADQDIAFTSNVTAGSLLICCIREGSAPSGDPVLTDTRGNTWAVAQRSARNTVLYAVNGSSGACTVTINATGTTSTRAVVLEFSGTWPTNPLDTVATATAPTASPFTTNSVTPTAANGVAIAFLGTTSDANPFSISGGGYTLGPTYSNRAASAYQTFSSIAAYAATFTAGSGISGGTNAAQNIAFIETGGGGGGPSAAAKARYRRLANLTNV